VAIPARDVSFTCSCEKGKYDIVHAHFGLTLVSMLFVRVPVVVTFHGSDLLVNPTKYISRLLAPMASKVILVSQKLKECLGYGEVISCGIDVQKFAPPSPWKNKQSPKLPGKLKVLFPSDPARKIKGYDLFQAVCQQLERQGNKVEEVHLVHINRADVPKIYWDCDIMLLTSRSEGSPTVIKEAIAAKLPFVSVNVGDVKDWVRLIDFGMVVPDKNPKGMAEAVVVLLQRISYRSLLENSKCLEIMDISNTARQIRSLYDELLQKM